MTKTGKIKFSILFVFCFFVQFLHANESLKVEIHPEDPVVGEQVDIVLSVQATDDFEASQPQVPEIAGLKIIKAQNMGQSSSTRMNFINGKTEFSKTVTQQFLMSYQAVKVGTVVIPSFNISINGKTISSAPQKIMVGNQKQSNNRQGTVPGRPQYQQDDPFADEDDMFSQLMKQREKMIEDLQRQMGIPGGSIGGRRQFGQNGSGRAMPSVTLDVNMNEAFFLHLETDKKTAYEGEQITAHWYFYTRGQVESLDRAKFPDLKGFWKEIIEEVPALQFEEVLVNNVPYRRALLASHALFPIKAGNAAIDEFKIKAKVRLPTQFGWGDLNDYTKASKRMVIQVLPLPLENRPQSFSGAVGQFQIQTQIEGLQFPAEQPISLKVRFEGQGNAKLIELPSIAWPEGLEVYDTKSEAKFYKNGQSYKEFEILLLAHKQGEVKVPQINFSYFDPLQKQYVTKSTEEFAIKITEPIKGQKNETSSSQKINGSAAEIERKFLPVAELSQASLSWSHWRFPVLGFLSFFILISFIVQPLWVYRQISYSPNLKQKVIQRLNLVDSAIKAQDYKKMGRECVNLLYLIVSALAQEKNATQDWAVLLDKMPENYRHKYQTQLNELFDYFQTVGFAPEELRREAIEQRPIQTMVLNLRSAADKITADLA